MTKELTDREIDERVAKALGWGEVGNSEGFKGWSRDCVYAQKNLPPYSTDIRAAFEIIEHLLEKGQHVNLFKISKKSEWVFWFDSREFHEEAMVDTAPKAICLAFLKLKEKA